MYDSTMKLSIITLLVLVACFDISRAQTSSNQTNNYMEATAERSSIENLICAYSDAFNAADISKTIAVYAQDGVLMPQGAPTAIGTEQLKATFGFLFSNFRIRIDYVIDAITVHGDYAYARTSSKVNTVVIASGETISIDNKELFVLQRVKGQWKISHYIFNNTTKRG
jgi:ketosteroid isomerase-like protein